jgi:thiol-disulfide isomerase/thioredoxin
VAVTLACALLAGCGGLEGTGGESYVSGNGQVTEISPAGRDDAVSLDGEDLDGKDLSLESRRGDVVVVNVWGAWCAPCRKEAPLLTDVANELGDVSFVGINIRDASASNARAFVRTFDLPFPSIYDPRGTALLAFGGQVPPNAIPTTLVLDREGRIAARVLGPLPSATTLKNIIEKVVAEDG